MNILKEKRKELGLTQIQAAQICGVSRRTYQTYEESDVINKAYQEIIDKLNEIGILDGTNYIVNIKTIKSVCEKLFKEEYPEVKAAYLFGSYARGEATSKSDIDILIVCEPMGMKLYGISVRLEEELHKKVDIVTHRQLNDNFKFMEQVLKDGIKIYGTTSITKNRSFNTTYRFGIE